MFAAWLWATATLACRPVLGFAFPGLRPAASLRGLFLLRKPEVAGANQSQPLHMFAAFPVGLASRVWLGRLASPFLLAWPRGHALKRGWTKSTLNDLTREGSAKFNRLTCLKGPSPKCYDIIKP